MSRAKNLIRRVRHAQASAGPARQALRQFGDWLLDADRRRLIDHAGNETLLTHGEFQLLGAFLRNSGHTLSRDQLMDQIRNREWLPAIAPSTCWSAACVASCATTRPNRN